MLFVQAALNGDRKHTAVPRSADQIAQDTKADVTLLSVRSPDQHSSRGALAARLR